MPQDRQYKTINICVKCVKNDNWLLKKIIKRITSTPLKGNHALNITKLNKYLKIPSCNCVKISGTCYIFLCGKPHPSAGENKV